jgi:hypothetical protein
MLRLVKLYTLYAPPNHRDGVADLTPIAQVKETGGLQPRYAASARPRNTCSSGETAAIGCSGFVKT